MAKVLLNGELIDESLASVPITDKGYFFDFSVYSSVKVVNGKIFLPQYHVDRLFESAGLIGLNHDFNRDEVLKWLDSLIKANSFKDVLLRMVMIGDPDKNETAKLYIFSIGGLTFYPDKFYKTGVKVITWAGERRVPGSKTKDLLMSFLAFREAKIAGALDALLVDKEGYIREGTRSNFFAIRGDELVTAPSEKVLEGVTKKIVLEAAKNDFKIFEENIPADKLSDYDEFFITSTSMNVMPVRQIDDYEISTGFEKTRLIARLFKDYLKKIN